VRTNLLVNTNSTVSREFNNLFLSKPHALPNMAYGTYLNHTCNTYTILTAFKIYKPSDKEMPKWIFLQENNCSPSPE